MFQKFLMPDAKFSLVRNMSRDWNCRGNKASDRPSMHMSSYIVNVQMTFASRRRAIHYLAFWGF
jgi:hypothetical protein